MADNPGVGGGKIRPKRSTSSKKPYSRAASQRKSLFSRVTDSFKTFLNPLTPKWFTKRIAHGNETENQEGTQLEPPVIVNHQERQEVHTNNNYKRSPLSRPHLTERGGSPTTSLKYFVTPPDTPLEEEQAKETPSGGKHDLLRHLEMSSKRQKMSKHPSPRSEKSNLTKELIYLTTNDNASVASSSGCSSSTQATQHVGSLADQEGSQKNLWSSSMDSLASSRTSSQQQVTMGSHKRPRFNPAIFSIPSMGSPSHTSEAHQSSFYQGPVQYGGANASFRSAAYFATPRKTPSVTKVKVRHINHQRAGGPGSRTSSTSSKSSQSDLSATGMSSTAKKILQTLERMSSPLNDARKIPSVARTPSAFMAQRQQRRRTIAGSSMLNKSLHAPPTMGLSTPVTARVRKSIKMPLNNSLLSSVKNRDQTPQRSSDERSAPQSHLAPDSTAISTRGMPAPLASMSSAIPSKSQRSSFGESSSGGGGKMKSQRRSHYSAMQQEEEEEEEPDLPAVALPLTASSNLPSFNFNKSLVTSTPALRVPNKLPDSSQPEFNFASPVVKTTNNDKVQTTSDAPQFQFSSPPSKVASSMESKETPNSTPSSNFNVGTKKATPSLMFAPDPKVVSAVRASKQKSPPSPAQKSEEQGGFSPADTLKSGSVMDILAGNTSKNSKDQKATTTSITNPFKQVQSGWECDTCLIRNDESKAKCAACETPRSGTKAPTTFKASQSNKKWECDTCLVRNDASAEKCIACETPRTGAAPASSTSAFKSTVFNVPSNSSFTFGVSKDSSDNPVKSTSSNNPPTDSWGSFGQKTKPPLSKTSDGKPSFSFGVPSSTEKKQTDAGKSSGSSFGAKRSTNETKTTANASSGWGNLIKKSTDVWECEMCMITNSNDRKTCEACESPKPGTEKQDSLNSSFKFGQASAGLFKFGIPDSKPVKDETAGKGESVKIAFGSSTKSSQSASQTSKPPPTVSFGVPSTVPSTSQNSQDKNEPVKTESAPTFGKTIQQSSSKNTSETAPKPLFSFGLPKTQATLDVKADSKPTEVAPQTAAASTVAAFGVPPPSYSNSIAGITPASAADPKPSEAPAFTPAFGTNAPTPQAGILGFGSTPTVSTTSQQAASAFGGFKTTGASSKVEEKKPALGFSFGAQSSKAGSTFQFSGSTGTAASASEITPAGSFTFGKTLTQATTASSTSTPTFNFGSTNTAPNKPTSTNIFGAATPTSAAPTPFTGFGTSTQPAQQKSDSSTGGFGGFNFTGSQKPSTTSGFGSNPLKSNDPSPFGSSNQAPSMFSTSKPSSTPFGAPSTTGNIFGSGGAPKPAFGTTATSDPSAGIPKPSFSFGQSSSNQAVDQKQGGFSAFQFSGSNNSSTPSNSGFNFGAAAASKPAPAFGSNSSTGFQFGASQQQSNGTFNFGASSNQPKPEQVSENKSSLFVFGGNAQSGNNAVPQQPSAGFNFGASASTGTFNFGGSQSTTPQSSMFSMGEGTTGPPNQNPFSASVGRSTTPVQGGRRVIRQARRKLRK